MATSATSRTILIACRPAWTLAALLVGAASPVAGQEVAKGRLVDASTGEPVGDAMVAVLDGRGVEQDRRLTGRSGGFEVLLTGSPPFTLVVERIGFRRQELPLDPSGPEFVLRLTAEPIELPGMTVASEPVCSISSQAASEPLGAAWDLVHATLARTTLGAAPREDGNASAFDVVTYFAEMDRDLNFRSFVADTLVLEGAPFAFVDSTALEATGWSEQLEGSQVRYFAPSPGFLLSAWFRANHCFALEATAPDTLALRFRSAPELAGAGIEGAFFLDRAASRVATVEFRHLTEGPQAPHQGGEIVLADAGDGSWYVQEWWMRTPIFESRPTSFRGPLASVLPRWRQELGGYRVRGGLASRRTPALAPGRRRPLRDRR